MKARWARWAFAGVNGVRQGKYFEIDLAETDKAKAMAAVKAMCEKLIANTVIENYDIELLAVKSAVVVFPGINRERDMMLALEKATGQKPVAVWHTDTSLPKVDLVVVPGGFSYGDYLRCGAIAARSPIMTDIRAKA